MHFIGVDLAWSDRNTSAIAVIYAEDASGRLIHGEENLQSDDEIISFISQIAGTQPALVAIDAPLIVPNLTGSRPCDREVTRLFGRYHAGTLPANRNRFGGKVRGEEIVHQLVTRNFTHSPNLARQAKVRQVIEVYPHPATVVLFNLSRILKYKARKGRKLEERQKELTKLQGLIASLNQATPSLQIDKPVFRSPASLASKAFKDHEDLLDAIICAYIIYYAWYWGPEGYRIYGNLDTGYILVPARAAFPRGSP